jgi:hypothetical protein
MRARTSAAMAMKGLPRRPVLSRNKLVLPALGCGLLAGGATQAHAQLIDRYFPANVPAYQEWSEAAVPAASTGLYAPQGVRVGSFTINPGLSESFEYDSNPFGTADAGVATGVRNIGSAVIDDALSLTANSDWSRDGVNASVTADRVDYLSYPRQSYTTWTATAGGVIDYDAGQILAGYSHIYGVSLPTDVGTFGAAQPIFDQVDDLRISDTIGPGRFTLVPAIIGDYYQFSTMAGAATEASLFNRQALTTSLTAGYEFAGGHNALLALSNTLLNYSGGISALRPAGYDDVSVMAGLEYRQSALLIYRVLAGYETRSATGSGTSRNAISAPAAEADVIWKPSVFTTVTAKLSQGLQDAPTDIAQGLTETNFQLILDHSLGSDIALNASARYIRAAFPSSPQIQSVLELSGMATYYLSRNIAVSLSYEFSNANDSSQNQLSFTRHQVVLQARFAL